MTLGCRKAIDWVFVAGAIGACFIGHAAQAQTLQETLAQAYTVNPRLEAARAALRATDEEVPQALSGFRPTVEATASIGFQRTDTSPSGLEQPRTGQPKSLGVAVTQPIYRGGRTSADVNRAESTVQAARANLFAVEQETLLSAATAFLDVVRDQAVVELNANNEQVIRRQLEATQERFRVGEVTRTDVSQAESRLSGATASRIQAEGVLASSRAIYQRIVGAAPGRLVQPRPTFALPTTLEDAVQIARSNNPNVVASQFIENAARSTVDLVRGEALPTVSVNAQLDRTVDGASFDRTDGATVQAQVVIPLYQAGAVTSRIREARQVANQRRIEIDQAQTEVIEVAVRAWQALVTARASIVSQQAQVRAAEIALDGVRQEATVGARTTLDVLDAEQELLDARVGLVQSQRDELVAAFQLLSAIGELGARQLALPVEAYDFDQNYRAVRNRW